MLQYLLDRNEARPVIVLYGNETRGDIAYRNVLDAAERELGIPTVYAVVRGATEEQYAGYIDARLVRAAIPDFSERTFYISGPQAMVKVLRHTLQRMGVRRSRIKVDFFPGFA
jgi:ferredoxin-NADP reductase